MLVLAVSQTFICNNTRNVTRNVTHVLGCTCVGTFTQQ